MEFEDQFDELVPQEAYQSYLRFQQDLEFIQLLSNPKYLHCLFILKSLKFVKF